MSSVAWVFQRAEQVRDMGEDNAPWHVGWYDPDGGRHMKSFGPGFLGKRRAERHRLKLEDELMTGRYRMDIKKPWAGFRKEYEERVLAGLASGTREQTRSVLDHFERIVKPVRVLTMNTSQVDAFIAARRQEPGKKRGTLVSPATLNKELRHLKAVLRVAVDWGYLAKVPKIRMQREPKKLPRYVSPEHFAAIYQACEQARYPEHMPYPAADWWRALLVFAYMTGWRIGDLLSLTREDTDLEGGYAITRSTDPTGTTEGNKGRRDERVKLHPLVVEHLRRVPGFTPTVFPYPRGRTSLTDEFHRIQRLAGIALPCRENHEHTPRCHVYGFHDVRRAFATLNATRLTADALQSLMRHKAYTTTQRYINMARQVDDAVNDLFIPDLGGKKVVGNEGNA